MTTAHELLFALAVLWCVLCAYAATSSRWFVAGLIALGAVHWLLAADGVYADATAFPPPQAALLGPVLLALIALLLHPKGRAWLGALPLIPLTALHILRIPVELVLHGGYEAGLVPQGMTYSGHNFDIVSGLTAIGMVAWMASKRPPSRAVLVGWNIVCLVLLAIVVVTAALSVPSTVQRINFEQPNVLVVRAPYVLLPALLVPCVLWAHMAALTKLLRRPATA